MLNLERVESEKTWQLKPSAARTARGGSATVRLLQSRYQINTSASSVYPSSSRNAPPNRRVRTRTHGGVGGKVCEDLPIQIVRQLTAKLGRRRQTEGARLAGTKLLRKPLAAQS
jgi:hypothetical protein